MEYFSFHMVMSREELNQFNKIKGILTLKKTTETVDFILEKTHNIIKSLYNRSGNHQSQKPESNNRKKHFKFRIRADYYHKIKLFHGSKNVFSMARIYRLIFDFFYQGIIIYGSLDKFLKTLKKISKNLKTTNEIRDFFLKKEHIFPKYQITLHFLQLFLLFVFQFY